MQAYAVSYSRYVIAFSVIVYTVISYLSFALPLPVKRAAEIGQRICMVVFCLNAYLTLSLLLRSAAYFTFGVVQTAVFLVGALLYRRLYQFADMQMYNNICMLLSIGLVMICRINFGKGIRQFIIALFGIAFLTAFPMLRDRMDFFRRYCYFYAVLGIAALGGVLFLGSMINGSMLNISIFGFTLQLSEFVKILFLLFLAGALCEPLTPLQFLLVSATAAVHVGILVVSRDLGGAVIFYITYITLLFLATGKRRLLTGGLLLGAAGAVVSYFLFSHVRVRVQVFLDPWSVIDGSGYQITQSLFALSFGGPFGAGLTQGMPSNIPFVESDFIFSAIAEEMGLITAVCLILLCIHIFIEFLQVTLGFVSRYYQLFVFGAASMYLFQIFLTIGGGVKFIPLTGVTLPLVSYGGSSVLASLMMMGIVGAVFMLQSEQIQRFRERYEEEHKNPGRSGLYETFPDDRNTAVAVGVPDKGEQKPGKRSFLKKAQDLPKVPYYDPDSDYEGYNHFDL